MDSPYRKISYTVADKLAAIKRAQAVGNRAAGREIGTNECNICKWRQQEERLLKMNRQRRASRGTKPRFPELEKKLFAWIEECQNGCNAVTATHVRIQALVGYIHFICVYLCYQCTLASCFLFRF